MYFPERARYGAWIVLALALFGCGGGSSSTADSIAACTDPSPVVAASQAGTNPNELRVTVNAGISSIANRLYTDVTICQPGSTSSCRTVNNILVDTGSTGLRVMYSAISSLPLSGATGNPVLSCEQFLDQSFAWGPVKLARVVLGNEVADNLPIQIVADPTYSAYESTCSPSGTSISSASLLGANGILGIGTTKQDCGPTCATTTNNGFYFTCPTGVCSASLVATTQPVSSQLQNPVARFAANNGATDNNGVMVSLPSVGSCGATSVTGSVLFGVGTRSNNQPASATLLQAVTRAAYISTNVTSTSLGYTSGTMVHSFLDTGSNGLYFETTGTAPVATCFSDNFYCPATPVNFTGTLTGSNAATKSVVFTVRNASTLFSSSSFALPSLAGPSGSVNQFDWGLPFFYGRNVFIGIEGSNAVTGSGTWTGPYYAF
jgi:hypothetical protein